MQEAYQLHLPRAIREPYINMEAYWVEQFLTNEECAALISCIRANAERSTTTDRGTVLVNDHRTSDSANLSLLRDPFIDEVDLRICRYMGMNWTRGEGLQGQYYDVGEEFKPHHDYLVPATPETQGQRAWTFMIFLNDVEEGGRTTFPMLSTTYTPRAGCGLLWRNLDLAGNPNPYTLHSAEPVTKGFKAVLTKWFRQRGEGVRFTKAAGEYLPAFSAEDFRKARIPGALYRKLVEYHRQHAHEAVVERGAEDFIRSDTGIPSEVSLLPEELRNEMHAVLRPVLESWVGMALQPSRVYGIRRYRTGATLAPHLDTYGTHIVSATLNIDQQLNRPWPLHIRDSYYRLHEITIEPGEMVLYEGARLEHARLHPLDGDHYASAFVHYYP